jgi:alanine racemase
MGRLGFTPEQVPGVIERLAACPRVAAPLRLMTHLACADDPADPATRAQLERMGAIAERHPLEISIANSAGVLGWPQAHAHWVRPGIMLYGISPFPGRRGPDDGLVPVMSLESHLIVVRQARRGARVGYGGGYVCPQDMRLGVIAAGYGDGYPRHVASGTPVLVNGVRVPIAGRVSMDMIIADLRDQPAARPGDPVILWGHGLPVEEIAERAGTIGYELVCQVTGRVAVVEDNP